MSAPGQFCTIWQTQYGEDKMMVFFEGQERRDNSAGGDPDDDADIEATESDGDSADELASPEINTEWLRRESFGHPPGPNATAKPRQDAPGKGRKKVALAPGGSRVAIRQSHSSGLPAVPTLACQQPRSGRPQKVIVAQPGGACPQVCTLVMRPP